MDHCVSYLFITRTFFPPKIGVFRLRSSKEDRASCEGLGLRNGLYLAYAYKYSTSVALHAHYSGRATDVVGDAP